MTEALEVNGLTVSYPHGVALSPVSFSLGRGSAVVVDGPSGSGKTTLGLALNGLLTDPASVDGSIALGGVTPTVEKQWRSLRGRSVGYVAQDAGGWLHPARRVGAQLAEAIRQDRTASTDRLSELLHALDLSAEVLPLLPAQLSGGMRQRAAIALALATRPAVLVADEPTSALDEANRDRVVELLHAEMKTGLALVLMTHDQVLQSSFPDLRVELSAPHGASEVPAHSFVPGTARHRLQLRGVRYAFGRHSVLAGFDLVVREGETVALVGPSGSGKSTVARLAVGLLHADGVERRGSFQFVGQDAFAALDPRWTTWDSVEEPLRIRRQRDDEAVDRALEQAAVSPVLWHRKPGTLSGGQRARVALARAMVSQPDVIVMDEPLASVDAALRDELLTALVHYQRAHGTAFLLVTHDPETVSAIAHRTVTLA